MKRLIIFSVVLFVTACFSCSGDKIKRNDLLELSPKLEQVLSDINHKEGESFYQSKLEALHLFVNEHYPNFNLCEVRPTSFGVVLNFDCRRTKKNSPGYSDKEYFLIKLHQNSSIKEALGYEQYVECANTPKALTNNWFFISRHLKCD